MTPARAIMIGVAAPCLFAGVWLLAQLRQDGLSEPRRVLLRIWGVVALAFGAMLTTFATSMPSVSGF